MLDKWLRWKLLSPNPYKKFAVIHIDHSDEVQPEVRKHLEELMIRSKLPSSFIARVSRRLNWDAEKIRQQLIAPTLPTQMRAKRGEFGEILTCALLEEFAGFSIPVPKLWFKLTSGQSLPATDALAIKVDNSGEITEVCYVESKLRTKADHSAAVQAAKQLQTDTEVTIPDILRFVAQVLDMKESSLADAFADYLADRSDTREKETFCIGLCWESSAWNDTVLKNLEDDGIRLEKLSISVIRIDKLGDLTNELFKGIGVEEVEDDD